MIAPQSIDSVLLTHHPEDGKWESIVGAMKPGAHLLLFSNVKEHHLGAIYAEDAGLEIRDTLAYVFADGENGGAEMQLIAMARKPLEGTVAANVLKWGCGGLNIDGCRVTTEDNLNGGAYGVKETQRKEYSSSDLAPGAVLLSRLNRGISGFEQPEGRWPANLILQDCSNVRAMFPNAGSGNGKGGYCYAGREYSNKDSSMFNGDKPQAPSNYNDNGSAARFFYSAPTLNNLVAYLIKLTTPPGGTVLVSPELQDLRVDNYGIRVLE